MDIYVISLVWWREGSTVIGAAVDLTAAEAIGDRYDDGDMASVGGWKEWKKSADPHEQVWRRDALNRDGGVHASLSQEIVRVEIVMVPLAGYDQALPWSNPEHDVMGDIRALMDRRARD